MSVCNFLSEDLSVHVDHNILRHLNIEKDSEQYKKFEYPNPLGLSEKLQKNIEDIQHIPVNHEVKPAPTLEEKAHIRESMFSFLDEARMEETRLVGLISSCSTVNVLHTTILLLICILLYSAVYNRNWSKTKRG